MRTVSTDVASGVCPFAAARCPLLPLQVQDHLARSEEERIAGTAREKLNRGGRLSLVRLEAQWHARELRFRAARGQWERARVLRRNDGCPGSGLPGGLPPRLPLVMSRGRRAGTKGDRNYHYRERRRYPKRTRPDRNRRLFACHTRWSFLPFPSGAGIHQPGLPFWCPATLKHNSNNIMGTVCLNFTNGPTRRDGGDSGPRVRSSTTHRRLGESGAGFQPAASAATARERT
jgi:hypothetical protein